MISFKTCTYWLLFLILFIAGGHTIGTTACQFFRYRLYNFTTTGNGADPSINPAFVSQLQTLCPQNGDGSRRIGLDTGSQNRFDSSFFANLRSGRGILESDQKLWTDATTRTFVQRLAGFTFGPQFGRSMVKMSNIGVKTGTNGEIRRVCSAINWTPVSMCLSFYLSFSNFLFTDKMRSSW